MHCATCGVHFYHLDILLGNCIITASGYAHVRTRDCDAAKLRRRVVRSRREIMYSPPGRPHNQAEHMNTKARVRVTPLITPQITPRIVLPVTPTTVVPHAGKPIYGGIRGWMNQSRVFDVSDDEDTDDILEFPVDQSRQPIAIDAFGYTGEMYWMHYMGHVFLGKKTKHMQGVLLAIADIYDQPVPTLNEAHYKESTHALPLNAIMHQIVVTDVFNSLAEPFRLRELKSGEYTLIYNDHEITHSIKAVLAGYVVAVRALMD
jgi:hypothetical protein